MAFTQFEFLCIFLPLVLLIYEKSKPSLKLAALILSSFVFYSYWKISYLPLLGVSILQNYLLALWIDKKREKYKIIIGILANLSPLFYFKYSKFILSNFGIAIDDPSISSFLPNELPLGISFYTFQQIAYIVDVYQNKAKPHKFIEYFFFVSFFPHLVAGPLLHHKTIIEQIGKKINQEAFFIQGLLYFSIGFVKKVFIADTLAVIVDPLFLQAQTQQLDFYSSFLATFGYSFQLYFDFSGYSDMAIGLGLLFGYRLPINFNSPYTAISIQDFWRRWHITLSAFLRDYIYIPLGGNRYGKTRQYINLSIVMLIGGFWHGASWTFIIWGGAHGLILAIERIFNLSSNKKIEKIYQLRTFLIVCLLWVIFRSENFIQVQNIYTGFLNFSGASYDRNILILVAAYGLMFFPNSHFFAAQYHLIPESIIVYLQNLIKRVQLYFSTSFSLCLSSIFVFYNTNLDYNIYDLFHIRSYIQYIDAQKGDFRSNLLPLDILHGDEKKVIFVGSSFTQHLGTYLFNVKGEGFKSGTTGTSGNSLVNGLRTATAILDTPHLHTIVLGVSPLNMGDLSSGIAYMPFQKQGFEGFNRLGINAEENPLGYAKHELISLNNLPGLIVNSIFNYKNDLKFYQYHGFLFNLMDKNLKNDPPLYEEIKFDEKIVLNWYEDQRKQSQSQPNKVNDQKNGQDKEFTWLYRGIYESLQTEGEVYKALKKLKRICDEKNINLVIYDTPTPNHSVAPDIYPDGFLEKYRIMMAKMCSELQIPYYDLIDLFPWDGRFMYDFIHPRFDGEQKACQFLHKYLIFNIFKNNYTAPSFNIKTEMDKINGIK